MASTNPLQGKDFVKEGYLDKAISEMETYRATTVDTLNTIKDSAIKADKALAGINTTTKEGKKQLTEAEKQAEKLAKAREREILILSDTEKELNKLKIAQQQQNRLNKLVIKRNDALEGSYDRLSAQYSINKIKLNAMSAEERKTTKTGKELESSTNAIYQEMKQLQEATGKHTLSVGDYAGQIGQLIPSLGGAANSVKALGAQLWALVANPVGLIIAAIVLALAGLYKAFTRTAMGAELLEGVVKVLGSVLDTLSTTVMQVISGEKSFWDALTGVRGEMEENIKATLRLTKVRRDLERQTAESTLAQAKLNKEIAALEGIADADSKSMAVREKAAIELTKKNVALSEERVAQAKREQQEQIAALVATEASQKEVNDAMASGDFAALKSRLKLMSTTEDYRTALNALIESQAKVVDAEAELTRTRDESAERLALIRLDQFEQDLDIELDITDRRKQILERQISDEETSVEKRKELQAEKERIIEESFARQMKLYKDFFGVQIDEQRLLNSSAAEVNKYAKELGLSERAVNRLREVIIEKQAADQDNIDTQKAIAKQEKKLQEDAIKRADALLNKERQNAIERANQQKALTLSEIDLLEKTEEEKTRLRLQAEKDRLKKVLEINKLMGGELSDLQIKQMENTIKGIDKQIQNVGKSTEDQTKDIYDLIGVNLDDDKKQAIADSTQFVLGQFQEIAAMNVELADRVLQKRQEEVEASKSRLDQEIEARNAGYANNVLAAQRELELNRRKEAQAKKDKEKAVKAQQRLDTVMQISGLITSSVQIWKALSGIPVIGPALAATAVGVMFASFAASKIKASQLAKEEFRDGGYEVLDGGSHASGNDIPLGVSKKGKQRRAEGGEGLAIFKKKSTAKYGDLIPTVVDAINSQTFEQVFSATPVVDMAYGGAAVYNNNTDMSTVEDELGTIRRQGERKIYTDAKGRTVEQYKNVTRTYV